MPRFFFDTDDGHFRHDDVEGFYMPSIEAACTEALDALPEMARNRLPSQDRRTISVRVRDEAGTVLYSASLDVSGEWHVPHRGFEGRAVTSGGKL